MKSWKALIISCLSLVLILCSGMATSFAEGEQNTPETQDTIEETQRLLEVVELREKTVKHIS